MLTNIYIQKGCMHVHIPKEDFLNLCLFIPVSLSNGWTDFDETTDRKANFFSYNPRRSGCEHSYYIPSVIGSD